MLTNCYDEFFEEISNEQAERQLIALKSDYKKIFTESVWPPNAVYIKEMGWIS